MLSKFSAFIKEDVKGKNKVLKPEIAGRMIEIHTGRYLAPRSIQRKSPAPEKLRSGAKDVVNYLHKEAGEYHTETIKQHSREIAKAIKNHFENGAEKSKIHSVHWTSNPQDPVKLANKMGITPPQKTKADIIAVTEKKDRKGVMEVSSKGGKKSLALISMKYTGGKKAGGKSETKINYSNPGLAAMEKHAGVEAGTYQKLSHDHDNYTTIHLGYTGAKSKLSKDSKRSKWEADKASNDPARQTRAAEADRSAQETMNKIMTLHRNAMSRKTPAELADHVRNVVSPNTGYPEYVVHAKYSRTKTQQKTVRKGLKTSKIQIPSLESVHIFNAKDHVEKHLSKFEPDSLHVDKNTQGARLVIKGRLKSNGKLQNVLSHGLKRGGTGPFSGFNGTTNLG